MSKERVEFKGKNRYVVYEFMDKNKNVIYIGKSINVYNRLHSHKRNKKMMDEVCFVKIFKCITQSDMNILELYLISITQPKYNKDCNDGMTFFELNGVENIETIIFSLNEIFEKNILNNWLVGEQRISTIIPSSSSLEKEQSFKEQLQISEGKFYEKNRNLVRENEKLVRENEKLIKQNAKLRFEINRQKDILKAFYRLLKSAGSEVEE